MSIVDHKRTAPKLPGASRSMQTMPKRVPTRASVILFACAVVAGVAGFYLPALFVIAAFLAWTGLVLRFANGKEKVLFDVKDYHPKSVFELELTPGTPEWYIRRNREGS